MSASTFVSQGPETSATSFLDFVRPDLEAVEARLDKEIASDVKTVYALSGHILSAGGKRLRPAMVCLSARAVCDSPDVNRLTVITAVIFAELLHAENFMQTRRDAKEIVQPFFFTTADNSVFSNAWRMTMLLFPKIKTWL